MDILREKLKTHVLPQELFLRADCPPEGGSFFYYSCYAFPLKGVVTDSALEAINTAKKVMLATAKLYSAAPLLLLSRRFRERVFDEVLSILGWILYQHSINPKRFSPAVREIFYKVGGAVERALPGRSEKIIKLLHAFCIAIDGDNAYRWRWQDAAMILDKRAFALNPTKELARIIEEMKNRDRGLPKSKYKIFLRIFRFTMFFHRPFRKWVIELVSDLDVSGVSWEEARDADWMKIKSFENKPRLGFDHDDWYFIATSDSYNYGGAPFEARMALRRKIDSLCLKAKK